MTDYKFIRPCVALSVMALVTTLSLTGCKDDQKAGARGPSPVTVVEVKRHDVPADLNFVAKTESSRAVEIFSRVNGFLEERQYVEGGLVDAGQVLFTMDKKPFEVQLDEAQASLASSQAAHLVAKQNLDRIRPLAKAKALSQSDLDAAVAQFQTTEAAVSNARLRLKTQN